MGYLYKGDAILKGNLAVNTPKPLDERSIVQNATELLTIDSLKQLIEKNSGITCVCFMGGDSNPLLIAKFAYFIKN